MSAFISRIKRRTPLGLAATLAFPPALIGAPEDFSSPSAVYKKNQKKKKTKYNQECGFVFDDNHTKKMLLFEKKF